MTDAKTPPSPSPLQPPSPAATPSEPASEHPTVDPVPAEGEVAEEGGPSGPEPTRFGDWERKGRCIDF